MKIKISVFILFMVCLFSANTVYADETPLFSKDLNDDVSGKILGKLSEEDRFSSYAQLVKDNRNFKYYVYSDPNSTDIKILFYAGSFGRSFTYSDRVEASFYSNEFVPNLYIFDHDGNFKGKATSPNNVSIYNGNGYYAAGYKPWLKFEQYDSGGSSGGSSGGNVFEWPEVVLDVFKKIQNILSNVSGFIKDIFVPSDTNIIQNSLKDTSSEISAHFKPVLDGLESIKEIFTPEPGEMEKNEYDFYQIEINIPELGIEHVQPFWPYNQSRLIISLICNSLLVIITLIHLIRRIMGSGDVIE
ncbi:TPA: hypothetical protein LY343_002741 [Enterococcus faecium]|nr:hypothetical protein [Enterococcus faecium]